MQLGCKTFLGGLARFAFGSGTYSNNVVQAGATLKPDSTGLLTITGAATVAPDSTTLASVVQCDKLLVTGAAAALCPSTSSKALIILAKTSAELASGGRVHTNGVRYPGDFGDVSIPSLLPAWIGTKTNTAALLSYIIGHVKTAAATAGTAFNAGGGGYGGGTSAGAGGTSGSLAGGSGGGGGKGRYGVGAAGNSAAPFAGTPGTGGFLSRSNGDGYDNYTGGNGGLGGGLAIILSPSISVGASCLIAANGLNGTNSSSSDVGTGPGGGGGGGGGIVLLVYKDFYRNQGTVSANGGAGGLCLDANCELDSPFNGYSGAAGSVNIIKM